MSLRGRDSVESDVGVLPDALRRDLVNPREHEHEWQADGGDHQHQATGPVRQMQQRHAQIRDLQREPGTRRIQDGYPDDIAALQFG